MIFLTWVESNRLLHKAAAESPNVEGRRMFKDRSCVDDF
jgi:hypothetical protein